MLARRRLGGCADIRVLAIPATATTSRSGSGINGDAHPDEDVTIGYGDIGIASTDGLNAGAENRDGSSGVNMTPLPTGG